MRISAYLLIVLFHFTSCKSYNILQEKYAENETIILKDYLFQVRDNKVANIDDELADSSFTIFKDYLINLNFPLQIMDEGKNRVDYFFLKEGYLPGPYKGVDTSLIISLVDEKHSDSLILIPFIEILNQYMISIGYEYYSIINITIFLVKNNQIVYRYSYRVMGESLFTPDKEKIKRNINTLEDWEKAINGAMKEYIERLE